jgi:hypothetical protein
MSNRFFDRQADLVEYLTSPAVVFGEEANVPSDPVLQGIDRGLLCLVARSCCSKWIKRVVEAFPRTFEILGADQRLILRAFVLAGRQRDISTLASARQFYEFSLAYWRHDPPKVPYLPDVAACEFAMVKVSQMAEDSETSLNLTYGFRLKVSQSDAPKSALRRSRTAVPLRCIHDIRSIFEVGPAKAVAPKRDTLLVVTLPAGSYNARMLEVVPVVFDLLVGLDDWADPISLGAIDGREDLVSRLAAQGLIEVA